MPTAPACQCLTPLDVLKKHWGYDNFRPMQAEIIASVLAGNDTLGLMATGGGKSLTFQVPALMTDGLTIVVTPLISLMKDQVDNLRSRGILAHFLHSGLTRRENTLVIDKCRLGKARLLYVSPEKLQSASFMADLRELQVKMIVVDEAHCISQWGYDFRPSYLKISDLRKIFPSAPLLALTASATPAVVDDIKTQLHFKSNSQTYHLSFNRNNLSYIVRNCEFKEEQLVHILNRVPGCGIVYVRARKRARTIAETLLRAGISADFYHAGLAPEEKNEKQNKWKEDSTRIMVATTAFGMGIDKPDVRIVVHFDPPSSLEEYYQEAGRAGRDGQESWAVSLVSPGPDKGVLSRRLNDSFPPKEFLRETYSRLCIFLGVAMGEGFQQVHEFNLTKFCSRFKLQPAPTDSALKLLTQAGYIEYIEEMSTRSRLMVLLNRHELYNLQLNGECERIFTFILRHYTGIFADYEYINEPFVASSLDLTERTVYEALLTLGRMHVIHYVPKRSTPYIMFTRSREPETDLIFPRSVYEHRRKQMEQRIDAMKQFLFSDTDCRSESILKYFGEKDTCTCGKCDICRNSRANKPHVPSETECATMKESIAYALSHHPQGLTINELAAYLGIQIEPLIPTVRQLLDEGILQRDINTTKMTITTGRISAKGKWQC